MSDKNHAGKKRKYQLINKERDRVKVILFQEEVREREINWDRLFPEKKWVTNNSLRICRNRNWWSIKLSPSNNNKSVNPITSNRRTSSHANKKRSTTMQGRNNRAIKTSRALNKSKSSRRRPDTRKPWRDVGSRRRIWRRGPERKLCNWSSRSKTTMPRWILKQ